MPKLLQQVRDQMRTRHYSYSTEHTANDILHSIKAIKEIDHAGHKA